jgi:hypothetical protein
MFLASAVLCGKDKLPEPKSPDEYRSAVVSGGDFQKLSHIRKTNLRAYGYLIEAVSMLNQL